MNAIRETGAAFSGNTEALALDLLIVTSLNEGVRHGENGLCRLESKFLRTQSHRKSDGE